MNIISKKSALEQGLKRYFTGAPCKYGHVAERHAANSCCVECNQENYRLWSKNNPGRERERSRKKRASDPKKYREYHKCLRLKNREKENERNRKWHALNKQKVSLRKKAWRMGNPEKAALLDRAKDARRRSFKKQAFGSHNAKDILDLLLKQRNECAGCRVSLASGYHVDHIVPLSRGGGNGIENIQCLCPPCNLSKGALTMEEWRERQPQ